jgi:hypothetical protein
MSLLPDRCTADPDDRQARSCLSAIPIRPLYKFEHAFARHGRWRRLSRCYEGTEASAQAWLEVAAVAHMFARIRVEPT